MELYRHFDGNGRLLYVGISLSACERLRQHREKSPWFERIATITIERFPSRAIALRAERRAIETEQPVWNFVHAVDLTATMTVEQSSGAIPLHLLPLEPGRWNAKLPEGYAAMDTDWLTAPAVSDLVGLGIPAMQKLMKAGCFPRSSSFRGGKITDLYRADEVRAWMAWNVTRKRSKSLLKQAQNDVRDAP